MVDEHGHVTGIDMTPEMLTKARAAAAEMGAANMEFVEREAEQLPFPNASFDVVISNGVIDLIPDKDAVLVDTYARSKFEDTRCKAQKFGARGTTVKAYKPGS
jgi:arsenite methyltransferase